MLDVYNKFVQEKIDLEEEIIKIKCQIDQSKLKYKLTGKMGDSVWFNKANFALEMKKIELKRINAEYEKLKRIMKAQTREENRKNNETFERVFLLICKENLLEYNFEKMLNLTRKAIETRE